VTFNATGRNANNNEFIFDRSCAAQLNTTIDLPDADLAVSFTNTNDCFSNSTGRVNTDVVVTNNGNASTKTPILVDLGLTEVVDPNNPNIRATTRTGRSYWFIEQNLSPGESVVLAKPYFAPTTVNSFSATAAINNTASNIEDTNPTDNTANASFNISADCDFGGGDEIDLEVAISTSNPNVLIYESADMQVTVTNTGTATARDVQVDIPLSNTTVILSGGTSPDLSSGFWNTIPFSSNIWSIPEIAPGETATLDFNAFYLARPFLYAQVIAADGFDSDSTPNNGDGLTANEDDEAVFGGTTGGNNCRIFLSIFSKRCNDNGTPDNPDDDTFSFTLRATGNNVGSTFGILSPINTFAPVAYGEDIEVSDFPISGGAVEVIVVDSDNASCRTELTVQPPATCSNGGGGSSDLVLTIDAPATYSQYTTVPVVYTITNNGDGMARNVVINTPQPDGTTNSSSETTQGDFDLFREQWEVGDLAAGESASLTWNIFAVTGDGITGSANIVGTTELIPFSISLANLGKPNTAKTAATTPLSSIQLYPTIT
ncbi:MAG: CARDB domain-containing protein, partial [Saprospiraceae bacterium]